MRNAGRQKYMIPFLEGMQLSFHPEIRLPSHQQHPFILGLNIFMRRDGGRTDDSLDKEILVIQDRVEALAFLRGCGIVEEIGSFHGSFIVVRSM